MSNVLHLYAADKDRVKEDLQLLLNKIDAGEVQELCVLGVTAEKGCFSFHSIEPSLNLMGAMTLMQKRMLSAWEPD
jgi:hypothetical protein